ncbi:hypothetical protein KHQ06_16110 [Nocardia tengchongensis]|uniref:Uncharacterized protein n=2 Tax=Nocardia tengchongensis TaxID=2055889 RepID=A0ABX8CZ92_9NOCA|nr:hypothetical protein [Nocardia tengchongensis]QVI24159.1 hypothetical protein KHQ06_16110 [Nocardia tengchongensis]
MPQKPQMPRTPHQPVELSAIHVRWSPQQDAYLAWSDAHPGHTATNPCSSLAAIDELLDTITP